MKVRDTLLLGADAEENRIALRKLFEDQYRVLEAGTSAQALSFLQDNYHNVTVVLLDIEKNGEEFQKIMMGMPRQGLIPEVPVLAILSPDCGVSEVDALEAGTTDVIIKPSTSPVIRRRLQTAVDIYTNRWHLEELAAEQAKILNRSNDMMVDALSNIIEHRSLESGQHVSRIRGFTRILLLDIAAHHPEYELNEELVEIISSASALHDIGKIAIPDAVLHKPGRLTKEEFDIMKTHTTSGCHMLTGLGGVADEMYLYYAYNICRHHHERWDGRGYPDGLVGDEIPLCAQAVGLADVYDALTTLRVYKPAFSSEKAAEMILNGECGVFSPLLLKSFERVREPFAELAWTYADALNQAEQNTDTNCWAEAAKG